MTTKLPQFMPGDPARKSAAIQNTLIGAARRALTNDFAKLNPRTQDTDISIVSIVNNTDDSIEQFKSVGIGAIVFDPSANLIAEQTLLEQPTFEAVYPPTNYYRGRFAVLLETIPPGGVGLGRVDGMVYVIVTDDVIVGDLVDVDDGVAESGVLTAVENGAAKVLWAGEITNTVPAYTKIALARISGGSSGSNSGNSVINFTILDWFPAADPDTFACDCVLAEVTRTSCATIAQVGDEVLVCDPDLCWFNLPIELLVGSRGRADWMAIDGVTETLECPTLLYQFGITDCLWLVSSLCCREEVYV